MQLVLHWKVRTRVAKARNHLPHVRLELDDLFLKLFVVTLCRLLLFLRVHEFLGDNVELFLRLGELLLKVGDLARRADSAWLKPVVL